MGAWGYGNLENDTAADFLEGFRDSPKVDALVKILYHVNKLSLDDKYLDASDCEEALAAVEIVAAAHSKCAPNFPTDIQQLAIRLEWEKEPNYTDFHHMAVRAVWFIREESELRELWIDAGELAEWEQVQEDLLKRLV